MSNEDQAKPVNGSLSPTRQEVENLKDTPQKKQGGARPGAGMPKGYVTKQVRDRQLVKKAFLERVAKNADRLFNAQMNLAEGVTMLFKVEKDEKGNDKKPELVTDQATIIQFIDECGGYNGQMDGDTYYFLTTSRPDNRAIDSMLDRAFGKPKESLDVTSGDKPIQQPLIISKVAPHHAVSEAEATTGS